MLKFNTTKLWVCLLLVTVCVTTQALAQSQATTGQIVGVVKDSAGAVIVGATITATSPATGFTQTVNSNDDGLYRIVLLPPGDYRVTITKQGFAETAANVNIGVGRTADLNVTLNVGGMKETVTVAAEMIEAQRHEAAAYVGDKIISDIPLNGRRFQDIVNTTPTAQTDPSRGGISMTGQRMVNTGSINVDGADYGQLFFGGIRGGERAGFAPTIPLDSIQEFQIIRAGYNAEFGRSTGGTITAITKSGTNAFHGNGGFVWRPDSTAKGNEFYDTVKSTVVKNGCTTCVVNPNPTLYQWGGSVGGPIKKDKFFFFGSYDQQRQRIPHQVFFDNLHAYQAGTLVTSQPFASLTPVQQGNIAEPIAAFFGGTAAGTTYPSLEVPYKQTNDAWLWLAKADYQLSNRHRLSGRFNYSNYTGANATSVGSGIAPTITNALSNNGTEIDKTRTVVGNLNSFFTHFANELRGQYARETRPRNANVQSPTVAPSTIGTYGTVSFLGQNSEYDYRIQIADNLTYIRGAHTFKLGGEYNHIYAAQTFGFNQEGQFNWLNNSATNVTAILASMSKCGNLNCTALGRFDDTNVTYSHQLGNLQAAMKGEQIAFFAQDSWRVFHNFTVNYGLRWDGAINPQPVANNAMLPLVKGFVFPNGKSYDPTTIPNQLNQFAPRLGFAWDPKGDGKTVIRGYGGIYYAATPLLLYAGSVNNFREPPGDLSVQLPIAVPASALPALNAAGCPGSCNTVYKQMLLAGVNLNSFALNALPVPTIAQIKQVAAAINTAQGLPFNPYSGAQPIFTDNNFKNPRSYQGGFGIERELSKGWTMALETSWIKTVNLQRDTDLNVPFSPCTDAAGRPIYRLTGSAPSGSSGPCATGGTLATALLARPQPGLQMVVIREPSAKSLYRAMTLRSTVNKHWGQINAYYTLSENIDDDYQERSASGVQYYDRYNFAPDYSYSDLNRRHQFVAQPVFFLPFQMEFSSALRFLSGAPVNPTLGADANQDKTNNDRPYWGFGQPMKRNSLSNRTLSFIDLRVQKSIKVSESKSIKLSTELFNVLNLMNITYLGTTVTNVCSTSVQTCGIPAFQAATASGNLWAPNASFLHTRNSAGQLITSNNSNSGYSPFEAQFSFRFVF